MGAMEEAYKLQMYKEVVHNLDDMVLVVGEENKVLHWNVKATEELYYDKEEFTAISIEDILHRTEKQQKSYQWKGSVYRKNGTCFQAKVKQIPMKAGEPLTIYIIDSIEEKKRLKEEIEKERKGLREALESKESFLANVTHELRTPINGMKGMAMLLKEELKGAKEQENLRVMLACCNNMERIVNDILGYAKLSKGKVKLEEQPFDIREWLQGIVAIQLPTMQKKNLSFSGTVAEQVPKEFLGDSYHLGQVLGNLLNNAVKFTKAGKIGVEVFVKERIGDLVTLMFVVTDTGIGIEKDKQETLFESFEQVDPSITREYGGTGLGLAIAKELVTLMKGEIGVESKIGEGARFYFTVQMQVLMEALGQQEEPEEMELKATDVQELMERLSVCMEFSSYEKAEEIVHQIRECYKDTEDAKARQAFRLELALRKRKVEKIKEQYEKLCQLN